MGLIGYRKRNGKKEYCIYDPMVRSSVESGHPARFSPEDTFSKYRIEIREEMEQIKQIQE